MADLIPKTTAGVSLQSQIDAVDREIRYRERVYPRLIAKSQMTQSFADDQILIMQAVRESLCRLRGLGG